jgi:hypothetical protein
VPIALNVFKSQFPVSERLITKFIFKEKQTKEVFSTRLMASEPWWDGEKFD